MARPPILLRACLLALALTAVGRAAPAGGSRPVQDQGAPGLWQKLLKLRTTASVMHTTAHPDDEHGGLLTMLSRGRGARVSLLTLTRGESGDNAIGPELFDALGLIRTEELLAAGRYYGLDEQYFGTVVDYGFSKRLDETIEKWGMEHALADVVRVIRTERPFVIVSRFQGNARDGHGNHAAAGLLTRRAYELAGDPKAFPDQIAQGLEAWQPLKLYIGGVRADEAWTIRLDPGEYDPVIGDSYASMARLGLSLQRSQTSGRFFAQPGPAPAYYQRLQSGVDAPEREATLFDGIDTTLPGLYGALRKAAPAAGGALLVRLDGEVQRAIEDFTMTNPSASVPALVRALTTVRQAIGTLGEDHDVRVILTRKERQIEDAVHAALGVSLTAIAQPPGTPEASPSFAAAPPLLPPVVPGQTFQVRTTFINRGRVDVDEVQVSLAGRVPWAVSGGDGTSAGPQNTPVARTFTVTVPPDAPLTRPHFTRASFEDTRYAVSDPGAGYLPWSPPALLASASYRINGVPVPLQAPVTRFEANLPYGHGARALAVLPVLSVRVTPSHVIVPLGVPAKRAAVKVEILHNGDGRSEGTLRLALPAGWQAAPASAPFGFTRAGERQLFTFEVSFGAGDDRDGRIEAVASANGIEYREGHEVVRHRDLETRYLYREAAASVRGVDVSIAPGLQVGYVMGIGDEVPAALAQLGAGVHLLGTEDLATGELGRFDAIITGTRAYAVREDLRTYNRRLLDYARAGGNLIVLYNTQELVPSLYAPYTGELPRNAEEVSEENSPVEILAPDAPVLNTPNRITRADFDGWVEQRGSKFWSAWAPEYTAVIATWDRGQAAQKGGWLYARYGKGHYTYFAYALHRQLPFGVPGAFRIVANLLSLNADARSGPAAGGIGR